MNVSYVIISSLAKEIAVSLLAEKIKIPGENHGPITGYWETLSR